MKREEIDAEVRRLSPWYYRFDLDGVRTDLGPSCDHHGHREVSLPAGARLFVRDRTVLDVGCNEGGYAFAALAAGARRLDGFDCRPVNVEKARFVARVRGHSNAAFHVSDADRWIREHPEERFDYVLLCGLLYHLPRPRETIARYCDVAREGVFLTCVLAGGADGYTPFPEEECIAASLDPAELSMMPNTTRTLVKEFEQHGFYPAFIGENRTPRFWGGCSLLLRNCRGVGPERKALARHGMDDEVSVFVLPARDDEWSVVVYSWIERPLEVEGSLDVLDASGAALLRVGPAPLHLAARVDRPESAPSISLSFPFRPPAAWTRIEAEVRERSSGRCLGRTEVSWSRE